MISSGDKVKHYEIIGQIGKGGMGEVYLAQDTSLDRKVAIKFLPEEMQKDAKARVRLVREAKAAASLDHPFICKIFETGEFEGKAFIVMEYIEGKDLRGKLDEGTLPLRDALQMALEIAEALEEAHEKGIVHRDLKPSNVMITPRGHVKVMDFGLAKHFLTEGEGDITQTLTQDSITEKGAIVGTLAYMSPEQARGDKVDARSDIFSLGILIYEMTTGRHPFSKDNPLETLTSILRDSTPAVDVRPRMMNPVLSPVLRKALAKEPENRYQSIKELIEAIHKFQREFLGEAKLRLRWWQVAAGAALIVAMIVTGVLLLTRRQGVSASGTGPEPISVIISDFQNQTGDSAFDNVLEQTFGIGLEGASFISIFNRQEALRIAATLDPRARDILDEELAQLVSTSKGINVIVSGSIMSSEKGFMLRVWARDAASSEKIFDRSEAFSTKSDILKAADKLIAKLRSELGDIPAESIQALAKETFTTTSLDAMRAFARGQELDNLGQPEEAIKEYLKAVDHDPNFGRAFVSLAVVCANLGKTDDAETYFKEAMKQIPMMTEREKYRTRGPYYLFIRDYKKAIEEYRTLLEQFPGDYSAHANLALAYFFARNLPKALEEGRLDVQHNPEGAHAHYNLSWYALGAGDLQTAEEEAQKVIEIEPGFQRVYVCLALTQLANDEIERTVETYQRLEKLDKFGASLASAGYADLAVYEGRLNEAVKILEAGIDFDLKNGENYNATDKYIMLAQIYLIQGKNDLAEEAAERAVETNNQDEMLFSAALIYSEVSQDMKARVLSGELSKKTQPEPLAYAKLIGGELSRKRGELGNAVNLFHEANSLLDTWIGHFFLGQAYLQAEDFTQANSEFEMCLKRRGEAVSIFLNDLPSSRHLPPVYYYLGRTQEELGSDAASGSYQEFLKIKEKDDESDPMVGDARSRLK
ncbi:MAG: protein kinase [Candidatus Aminicenantes bacterium]|jgi:tetratricopeptide (TPR) repeat protein/predicted Ser/Thr protein kinase